MPPGIAPADFLRATAGVPTRQAERCRRLWLHWAGRFHPTRQSKTRLIKTRFTSLGGGRIIHTPFPGQRQVVRGIVHIVLFSQFPGRIADKLLPRSSFSFRGMRRIRPGWQRRNRNRRYRSDVVNSHLGNQRGNRQQGTGKQSIAEDMFHANVCDLDRTKIHFFYQFNK